MVYNEPYQATKGGYATKTAEERLIYEAYIASPEWEAKRQELATLRNHTCEKCGTKMLKGFHAHHKHYANFGRENMADLMFLCPKCHGKIHEKMNIKTPPRPKKRRKDTKTCSGCMFSTNMKYITSGERKRNGKMSRGSRGYNVLYCNLKLTECKNVCARHRRG